MVSLSLTSGPIAQNEIAKMLEALSGTSDAQVRELDEVGKESEEIKRRNFQYKILFRFFRGR